MSLASDAAKLLTLQKMDGMSIQSNGIKKSIDFSFKNGYGELALSVMNRFLSLPSDDGKPNEKSDIQKISELASKNIKAGTIAKKLGINKNSVYSIAKQNGIRLRPKRAEKQVLAIFPDGKVFKYSGATEAAQETSVGIWSVRKILQNKQTLSTTGIKFEYVKKEAHTK